MLPPRKEKFEARKREDENLEFRTFLKIHAEEDVLDQQFLKLHNELFAKYDCSRCRNCCKAYYGSIPKADVPKDAEYLGITEDEFIRTYLQDMDHEENYRTKNKPCNFLNNDGSCKLGECKPDNCIKFPYTNQPERLQSLYSVLDAVEVCPVAFEIYERLKVEYGFRGRR